jgi:hypothetical protein
MMKRIRLRCEDNSASGAQRRLESRVPALVAVLLLATAALSCGGSPAAPSVAQVSGTWRGTITLQSATGGECLEPGWAEFLGSSSDYSLDISQNGSMLTGRNGDCLFTGTATADTFTLQLSSGACMNVHTFICGNGAVRDSRLVASTISARITSNGAVGPQTDTTNVLLPGTSTVVGVLVTTESLSLTHLKP